MSSTIALKKLSLQLQSLVGQPAAIGALITKLASKNPMDLEPLLDVERAIAQVTDDKVRNAMATTLYRWLDVHRVWMADQPMPKSSDSVYAACVPFTVKDLTLLQANNSPLHLLTLDIDGKFSMGPRDELFPTHKNLVLAVPLVGMALEERWALNFMLANSHRDTPVDGLYADMWRKFLEHKDTPEQVVFAYVFSLTVPGRPSHQAPTTGPTNLPPTPWAQYALDVLMEHAALLNKRHPELGLQLHAMTGLSEAVELASDLRFKSLFKMARGRIGKEGPTMSRELQALEGVSDEVIEEVQATLRAEREAHPVPEDELFANAVLSQVTCEATQGVCEFLNVNLFTQENRLAFSTCLRIPLGTLPEQARKWWTYLDDQGMAQVTYHATECRDLKSMHLGFVQDVKGAWIERELLTLGPETVALFKTAKWTTAFGSETPGGPVDEAAPRVPVTETFSNQINVLKAIQAHYHKPVLDAFQELWVQPGLNRREAYRQMSEKFPALQTFSFHDTFNAFPPSAMWAAVHHQQAKGVLFRVDPSVQEQLALTDVEHKLPIDLLHAPFPDVYLHLEQREQYDSENGETMWLEGAFVSERPLPDVTRDDGEVIKGGRELSMVMVLKNTQSLVSLHYPEVNYAIEQNDSRDLAVMLEEALASTVAKLAESRGISAEELEAQTRKSVIGPLMSLCKLLLYVKMPEARLTQQFNRTALIEQAKGLTGRDRQRLIDRAAKESDRIYVRPLEPTELEGEPADGAGRGVKPHFRRGYVRSQPYGEQSKLRRPRWIRPVMVNRQLLNDSQGGMPTPKEYKVK